MKISKNHTMIGAALIVGVVSISLSEPAAGQDPAPEKAQALLDKVKQGELDRQIAAKQTEIDRLKEDLSKGKKDADGLQQTMDATNSLINESTENLDKLTENGKRLEQEYNLTLARISAERQKIEGLRNLSDAQSKSLSALTNRIEETDVRSRVRSAEMDMLTEGKPVPAEGADDKGHSELSKLRKTLSAYETKTTAEEKTARDAMRIATAKVQAADAAAARVKRMADTVENGAPEPVAEKTSKEKSKQGKSGQGKPTSSQQDQTKSAPTKSNQPGQPAQPSTVTTKPIEVRPAVRANSTPAKP
jgi:uncharacterized small protein (DUF1192 family)/uncharacterized low-complexity protein